MNVSKVGFYLFIAFVSFALFSLPAEEEISDAELDLFLKIFSLDWKESGTYSLPSSHSTLIVPEGYRAVIGEDAVKSCEITGKQLEKFVESVVVSNDFEHTIYFSYHDIGYVSIDDWGAIKPKDLLSAISKKTEENNILRMKEGFPKMHLVGWVQEPTLDTNTNTVFCSLECFSEGSENSIINSIALRLGKKGVERITWVTNKENYKPFGGELDVMLRAHSYNPGYRYSDFSKGDKLAEYGIASLVAAAVGGKIAKSGGILIGLKKFWAVIIAGFLSFFTRKNKKSSIQSEIKRNEE